jgi:hypothetical protein
VCGPGLALGQTAAGGLGHSVILKPDGTVWTVEQIRRSYQDGGCKSGVYCGDFHYRQLVTTVNLTGQLVGSFCAFITNGGNGNAQIRVTNTWGLESGTRLPGRRNRRNASLQQMLAAVVNTTLVAVENLTVGSTVWLPAESGAPGR